MNTKPVTAKARVLVKRRPGFTKEKHIATGRVLHEMREKLHSLYCDVRKEYGASHKSARYLERAHRNVDYARCYLDGSLCNETLSTGEWAKEGLGAAYYPGITGQAKKLNLNQNASRTEVERLIDKNLSQVVARVRKQQVDGFVFKGYSFREVMVSLGEEVGGGADENAVREMTVQLLFDMVNGSLDYIELNPEEFLEPSPGLTPL